MADEMIERRNSIPIIYVKGTHYEVGRDVGKTFKSMIRSYLDTHRWLNQIYLPLYGTEKGKKAYEETLAVVAENFPQYIEEIRGTAEGADVPFYKLFLLHMDDIIKSATENKTTEDHGGCSTVCCNQSDEKILGHNEDALDVTLNHFYFVSAHIIEAEPRGKWQIQEEKFTSLCYAGTLPGFTMSYSNSGLVYSVNIIGAKNLQSGKTPRTILTRALLSAKNIDQAKEILTDSGTGIGDGVSINMIFLKDETVDFFYNAEAGPSQPPEKDSLVDIVAVGPGENIYHCNRNLRLNYEEEQSGLMISSERREAAMNSLPPPKDASGVAILLGDESDKEYPVFRNKEIIRTVLTGIFDLNKLTWSLFTDNPKTSEPLLELPINI